MKKTIKFLSVLCMILIIVMQQAFAATTVITKPEVSFVGIGHSPLVEGDTEKFFVTSISDKQVQYRIFLLTNATGARRELTKGYSDLMNPKMSYEISPSHVFILGKYKLEIWVREEGAIKEYDNTYTLKSRRIITCSAD
jgi:hypothetical protein